MVTIDSIAKNLNNGLVVYVAFDESDLFATQEPEGTHGYGVTLPKLLQRLRYANDAQLASRFDEPGYCDVKPYLPIEKYEVSIRQGSFGLNRGVSW
jgi:hypothetical protein